jgi:hemerythrin-like domain-containing protein
MNITELLKEDHREVESLISQLEGSADHETFGKIKNALKMHTKIEEEILYPAMEDFDETEELIDESYQEHDDVDRLLVEMSGTEPQSEDFQDLLAQLKDSIKHHVEEEENELFSNAESLLGAETLEEMGNKAEQMKNESSMTQTSGM